MDKQQTATEGGVEDLAQFLASTELFAELPTEVLVEWLGRATRVHLPGGEVLMRQGDAADGLYVVVSGRLRVCVEDDRGHRQGIGEVGRGECVGEMALLTEEKRSATVLAIRDTDLLQFSNDEFDWLLERHPRTMMQLARLIVTRFRHTIRSRPGKRTLSNIAVVPLNAEVPLDAFTDRLVAAFGRFGRTQCLTAERVDRHFGEAVAQESPEDPNNHALLHWLHAQEIDHTFVLYVADHRGSNWTQRCLRQADRILLVARAADPHIPEKQPLVGNGGRDTVLARRELVLLHEAERAPRNTAAWLDQWPVHQHHHVRLEADADFARLVRLLTGRGVGLVLGGGGARGFAHVGVIRALEEAGIPIDIVGGTSMGAVVAAACAMGWDHATIAEKAVAVCGKPAALFDFTPPMVALFAGRKITRTLKRELGKVRIEDLPRKFFCISSNLTRAQAMVHRRGPLWRAVRTSIALPGVIPPMCEDGEVLVDGGVLNNLPVNVMAQLCEDGPIIAVDVSGGEAEKHYCTTGATLSGWRVLWRRLWPLVKPVRVPSIVDILVRTASLSSEHLRDQMLLNNQIDLYLEPPVEPFGILELDAAEGIMEAGYAYARRAIERWESAEVVGVG